MQTLTKGKRVVISTVFKPIDQVNLAEPMPACDARSVMASRIGKETMAFVNLYHVDPASGENYYMMANAIIYCDGVRSFNAETERLMDLYKEMYGLKGIVYSVYFPNLV